MSEKDTTQSGESADAQQASQLGRWAQLRQKRWFRWMTDIAFFLAALAAITMWQGRDFVDAGEPAPAFELADLDGERHSLAGYAGKKTMVVFWAPWCGVCGAESDNVSRVQSWLGDRINVVSVVLGKLQAVDRTQAALRAREAGMGTLDGLLPGGFPDRS